MWIHVDWKLINVSWEEAKATTWNGKVNCVVPASAAFSSMIAVELLHMDLLTSKAKSKYWTDKIGNKEASKLRGYHMQLPKINQSI